MYGPSPLRKVAAVIACDPVAVMYPASQRSEYSGPWWKSAHFPHITPTASDGLEPQQVWKMPVRPVRHHSQTTFATSGKFFPPRRSGDGGHAVLFPMSQQRP